MNNNEKIDFGGYLIAVGEMYGKDFSKAVIGIWWDCLKQYELSEVMASFQKYIKNTDNGQFNPKPADIIRFIEGTGEGKAFEAWTMVLNAVIEHGSYASVKFADPLITQIILDMSNGWIEFCGMTGDEATFKALEFQKRYRAYLLRPDSVKPAVSHLVGNTEASNRESGFQGEKVDIKLIGKVNVNKLIGGVNDD